MSEQSSTPRAADAGEIEAVVAALRESEGRFRALVEACPDGIFLETVRGEILECNAAGARQFGYESPEAMVGLTIADLVPEEFAASLPEVITEDTGGVPLERVSRRRDGSLFPSEVATRLYEVGGEKRLLAYVRDVTERKRIEEELRRRERQFETLVESSPDIIARYDLEGRHIYANPTIGRLAGRPASDFLGRTNAEMGLPAEVVARWQALRERVRATRAAQAIETHLVLPSGERWLHGWVVPEFGADGELVSYFTVGRDITELKRAEQALRRSEERFRSLVENAAEIIVVLDAAGTIRYASEAVERVFGFQAQELLGTELGALVHPEDAARADAALARVLERPRQVVRGELRCRHGDGAWCTFAFAATNLLEDAAVGGIVINAHDVSENRLLEAQLRQSQKMEAVGQLAGGIAHDFNNLLTGIKGYATFLREALPAGAQCHADALAIEEAADRAAALTRQLLAYSRKQVLRPKRLDLGRAVVGLEELLRRLIGEDIELVVDARARQGYVLADPSQIEQVVVNLVVNARDAMRHGGRLELRTDRLTVREQLRPQAYVEPGEYVRLTVSDTGSGMEPATLARAFEPFFTTKPVGSGTGLGLSTVYGIVKQSGGYVWAESEPGRGTTFFVLLPLAPERGADPAAPAPALPPARAAGTVLLVEDEHAVRGIAHRILERAGYTVLAAEDGPGALELVREYVGPIDLLLTDVVMPRLSGKELAERLTAERPELRVVYMTGYTDDAIVHHGVGAEGVAVVGKPFTPAALLQALAAALGTPSRG